MSSVEGAPSVFFNPKLQGKKPVRSFILPKTEPMSKRDEHIYKRRNYLPQRQGREEIQS
jgi:hypothetical protein